MKSVLLSFALGMSATTSVVASTPCWLDSKQWSHGSAVGGNICDGGSWRVDKAEDIKSFCIYRNEVYSTNAIIWVEGGINSLICKGNGLWKEYVKKKP